ncbi:MAG: glycosyltransferase [Conexivisphaerales archaeon]
MKVCINSQTPLIKFKLVYEELLRKYGEIPYPIDVEQLVEGEDYEYSPGGVTAMIYPLLERMKSLGMLERVIWVSTGVNYPKEVVAKGIELHHVEMNESTMRKYAEFKEKLWLEVHGAAPGNFRPEEYMAYAKFNWLNAEELLKHISESDVYYVQDFQLVLTGHMIGPSAPAVLRWHVPYKPENLGPLTHRFVVRAMEGFDAVVVSTRRDLEGLIKSSYRGRAHQVYPFIDLEEWRSKPAAGSVDLLKEKLKLKEGDELLLMVARMDRIKSHDVAIKALSHIKEKTGAKLAIIGNGSFSSSKKGGLGLAKATTWADVLNHLISTLKLGDRVFLLGYLPRDLVRAAYHLCSAVLLTSKLEGFGITVLEGWANRKPVVVSKGAGVSELVVDGSNGYTFTPGDDVEAGEAIMKVLSSDSERLGENGYETSRQCDINLTLEREKEILEEAISLYK